MARQKFSKAQIDSYISFSPQNSRRAYLKSESNTKIQPLFYNTKEEPAPRKTKHEVNLSKIIPLANEPGILAYTPIYP
jgi:hypothetical protein